MNVKQSYNIAGQWSDNYDFSGLGRKKNQGIVQSALEAKKSGKITVKKKINAANYMMRVAQAKTPPQVSAIIRAARADMQFVRSCNSEEEDIKKAMRILKRVVAKSRIKIKRLKKEAEMEQQEKAAQSAEKQELAERIRENRHKKKRARRASESADACDPEEATVSRTTHFNAMKVGTQSIVQTGTTSVDAAAEIPVAEATVGTSIEASV